MFTVTNSPKETIKAPQGNTKSQNTTGANQHKGERGTYDNIQGSNSPKETYGSQ
jgi:hypothetical protein